MSAESEQNSTYITGVRMNATALLNADDKGQMLVEEWNSFFGGAGQLGTEYFDGSNAGLDKTDIENAKAVFEAFHTWLDEGGYNRRAYLQLIRILS